MSNLLIVGRFVLRVATSKKGDTYRVLMCDLGYRKIFLSFDIIEIAQLLALSVPELLNIPAGEHNVDICTDVDF